MYMCTTAVFKNGRCLCWTPAKFKERDVPEEAYSAEEQLMLNKTC